MKWMVEKMANKVPIIGRIAAPFLFPAPHIAMAFVANRIVATVYGVWGFVEHIIALCW